MRIRLSTIASLMTATVAGLLLFQTSQNVQQAESRLKNTREALAKEDDSMRVLETEWDYLNRPDRIEELTRQHLKMQAPAPGSLVRDSAAAIAPPKPPVKSVPAVMKVEKPVEKTTLPMPAPVTNDSHQQFNELLNTLTKDGDKP
jgi:hypothetical protein